MVEAGDGRSCPECAGTLRPSGTEVCCEECGLVVDVDRLDRGPEWRSFADGVDRRRTGAPLTRSRHDRGLSTEIGYEATGRITGRKRRQLARMRREHGRTQIATKADSNCVTGFNEIRRLVGRLSLPSDATEQACALFESAQNEGLLPGRSVEGFAAASIYAVSRTLNLPRTIDEVTAESKATERELKAAYDAMNRELGLPTGPIDPARFLPRFASELDLEVDVERQARTYLETLVQENAIGSRNPCGVAAGCLYLAANERGLAVTQADAGTVADVSPATIRKTVERINALR
ncbi:transcription initiation factor IIB [Halovivax gelatinilyticus]|uniref:transcription initiation factor IIB n=1 Tax=Halovivax gelatinilyticus TaxID=2961597 RepID=UPI0020CA42BB|nr:transcription initiation factor IIB family protein [Halovivax gelatinilyticus]